MSEMLYLAKVQDGATDAYDMSTNMCDDYEGTIKMRYNKHLMKGVLTDEYLNRSDVLVKLKDTGNGVKVRLEEGTKIKMNYSEVADLYVALKYYFEDSELNPDNSRTTIVKMLEAKGE